MSQLPSVPVNSPSKSRLDTVTPDLSLVETLRVLEVARGMRRERAEAEVALARGGIREIMRKRLMDAAAITGDQITEADVDAAIDQYFSTRYSYTDPPFSFTVFLAHVYIRRMRIAMIFAAVAIVYLAWKLLS